jgi:hypothetical protein
MHAKILAINIPTLLPLILDIHVSNNKPKH